MPAGRVKAVYFRVSNDYTIYNQNGAPLCYFPQFSLKMGYSADTTFNLTGSDSFRTNLTTLYGPDTFKVTCAGSVGDWIRIPVTKGNFQYTPERPFIVEIAAWPKMSGTASYPGMMASGPTRTYKPYLHALNHTATTSYSTGSRPMDIGIDLGNPTEIVNMANITSFGMFPNPTADGRFNISIDSEHPMKDISVTVSTVTGQQILSKSYRHAGSSFLEELNIGAAAKGVYFVRVAADGEAITRRIVVQ